MTVKQLIKKLKKLPGGREVYIRINNLYDEPNAIELAKVTPTKMTHYDEPEIEGPRAILLEGDPEDYDYYA